MTPLGLFLQDHIKYLVYKDRPHNDEKIATNQVILQATLLLLMYHSNYLQKSDLNVQMRHLIEEKVVLTYSSASDIYTNTASRSTEHVAAVTAH